jgi:hypothetical protein
VRGQHELERGPLRQCERFAWARRRQLPAIFLLECLVTRTEFLAVHDATRADREVLTIHVDDGVRVCKQVLWPVACQSLP